MIDTIPNRITAGRFALTIVLYILLARLEPLSWQEGQTLAKWAFFIFLIAAVSDFLDGYVARQTGQVTALGRILDPFVDKLLVVGAMVFLCANPRTSEFIPAWIVAIVLVREFFVTGLRSLVELQGKTFEADIFGKLKMGLQCCAVGSILYHLAWGGAGLPEEEQTVWSALASRIFVWATLASTVLSGAIYAFKAREKVELDKLP